MATSKKATKARPGLAAVLAAVEAIAPPALAPADASDPTEARITDRFHALTTYLETTFKADIVEKASDSLKTATSTRFDHLEARLGDLERLVYRMLPASQQPKAQRQEPQLSEAGIPLVPGSRRDREPLVRRQPAILLPDQPSQMLPQLEATAAAVVPPTQGPPLDVLVQALLQPAAVDASQDQGKALREGVLTYLNRIIATPASFPQGQTIVKNILFRSGYNPAELQHYVYLGSQGGRSTAPATRPDLPQAIAGPLLAVLRHLFPKSPEEQLRLSIHEFLLSNHSIVQRGGSQQCNLNRNLHRKRKRQVERAARADPAPGTPAGPPARRRRVARGASQEGGAAGPSSAAAAATSTGEASGL